VQCPLTVDQEAFQQNVNILDVDIIPEGGSDLGAAIEAAASAFEEGEGTFRVLVLFSDGEDHNNRAVKAAEEAAKKGIRIFTIGVGTPGGELLQVKDARGNVSFLRDGEGNVINSRLNEPLLQEIAAAAQGFYLPLGSPDTINLLYERGLAPLPRGELAAARIKRPIDRFQWPLGLAIVLLVFELFVSERRRVSRSDVQAAAPTTRANTTPRSRNIGSCCKKRVPTAGCSTTRGPPLTRPGVSMKPPIISRRRSAPAI
jgi:Ca-activated chloride channel homolog